MFIYGADRRSPSRRVHAHNDGQGRALAFGTKDATDREEQAENQRLAYVALTRAQLRLYLPLYARPEKTSTYLHIQRCLQPFVSRGDARFELALRWPRPPIRRRLPTRSRTSTCRRRRRWPSFAPVARGGLAMWSYTRLAHDLAQARAGGQSGLATSGGAPSLAIERAELDGDRDGVIEPESFRPTSCRPAPMPACSSTICSSTPTSTACARRAMRGRGPTRPPC